MEKFADEVVIEVCSGSGGNGCVAFRREKYVPMGGPSGGDGGRGGDVVFTVRRNLRTLAHLRGRSAFKAENGRDGEGSCRNGRGGADLVIPIPPGVMLSDAQSGRLVRDFSRGAQADYVFAKGGNGGWGNARFKSSINQAPRRALPGQSGKGALLKVELRVIADIGLVGFPNAGKSSLLDRFTNARPKIAPYPFTTKIPNLGVLSVARAADGEGRDVVIADIPGLIEGASAGAGLGLRFLKHISRAAALAFLIDLSDDGYLGAFDALLAELSAFSPELARKRRIVLGTKTDLPETEGRLALLGERLSGESVFGLSVFSGDGVERLAQDFLRLAEEGDAGAPDLEIEGEDEALEEGE
ncbi:MAG: GTPase ObgE [Treponema sp.]|nr:GTPase ObgE [Treponema sp.]